MKTIKILLLLILNTTIVFSQNWSGPFTLDGEIDDMKTGKITLKCNVLINGEYTMSYDSTNIVDGKFSFRGHIDEPVSGVLSVNGSELYLFLEAAPMKIRFSSSDPMNYQMTGSLSNEENRMINKESDILLISLRILDKQIKNSGNMPIDELQKLKARRDSIFLRVNRSCIDFAKINPQSFLILKYISVVAPSWLSGEETKRLYENFTDEQKQAPSAKLVAPIIKKKLRLVAGQEAIDFKFTDNKGNTRSLSNFKGNNYILLDFWEAWCGPCIANIPYIKDCYNKYKDKGLVVIAISSRSGKTQWKEGIEKHKTTEWYHIWEDNTKKTDTIGKNYDISSWPSYVLIDKNGMIVGKWSGGLATEKEEFEMMLKKLSGT